MNRLRWLLPLLLFTCIAVAPSVRAQMPAGAGPFFGIDLGASEPTNNNYRAHVQTGATGSPFGGLMFNDYLGVQGHIHFDWQPPDNDHRGFLHENQDSTLLGFAVGPRLEIPLGDWFTLNGVAEGGYFTGLSGRLNHSGPGFDVGGGLDFNMTPNMSVGLFGRYNRVYFAPHCQGGSCGPGSTGPNDLGPTQVLNERFGEDLEFVTAGVSLKWQFRNREEAPPPPPPPPPPMAQAPPPPPPPPAHEKIVLRAVHFDFNKSNIRPDARPVLDEAVRMLKEQPNIDVVVEGHTDSIGSDAYNMKLSHRRADSVKNYLVSHGISGRRIQTEGFGKRRPVASNDTEDGRAQNRRVEIHVR